jgi:hypothetical protein
LAILATFSLALTFSCVDIVRTPPTMAVRVGYTQDFTGTWQLNAAESKLDNTVSQTMKIEKVGPDTYGNTEEILLFEKQ